MGKIKYECCECHAKGCKLWREYGVYSRIILRCCVCAAKNQKRDISTIDAQGMRETPEYEWHRPGDRSDQIGWYVPAVQTGDGDFWGATSTPMDAYTYWQNLPTFPEGYEAQSR